MPAPGTASCRPHRQPVDSGHADDRRNHSRPSWPQTPDGLDGHPGVDQYWDKEAQTSYVYPGLYNPPPTGEDDNEDDVKVDDLTDPQTRTT